MQANYSPSKHRPKQHPSPSMSLAESCAPLMDKLTLEDRRNSITQTIFSNDAQDSKHTPSQFKHHYINRKKRAHKHGHLHNERRQKLYKQIDHLRNQVQQLQKQNNSLKRREDFCLHCRSRLLAESQQLRVPEMLTPGGPMSTQDKRTSKDSLEFEQIDLLNPLIYTQEMEEKSWIFLGTFLIAMGSKVMEMDGTMNVFKVLKNSIDSIRKQVDKCEKKIQLPFFFSKQQFLDEPSSGGIDMYLCKPQTDKVGLQLDGVKVQSVEQYQIYSQSKINYSINYQALLTIMEYARENCCIS